MEQITRGVARGEAVRVGVDLAKRVIQVHAVDAAQKLGSGLAFILLLLLFSQSDSRSHNEYRFVRVSPWVSISWGFV